MPRVPDPGSPGGDTSRDLPGEHAADSRGTGRAGSRVTRAGIGEQFADGQPLDTAAPGPALARALSRVTGGGLAGLSDDALDGYLGACQKIAAWTAALLLDGLRITLSPIAGETCDHHDAEPGYRPSRKLRHKIHTRTPACSYWGCRRPARQCDDDHTTAWDHGGRTCQCNLSPLCRRHHCMKQREGWTLTQPQPGIMTWTTPTGRQYVTTPAQYAS